MTKPDEYETTLDKLFRLMEEKLDKVTIERDKALALLKGARDDIVPALYAMGRDPVQIAIAEFLDRREE